MINGQSNNTRNGVKGNGLSDQPESVQKLMGSQLPSDITKAAPAGVNPAGGMVEKSSIPSLFRSWGPSCSRWSTPWGRRRRPPRL